MKIYPSPHLILSTKKPSFTHIPLAHTEIELIPDSVEFMPQSEDFILDRKQPINPYDTFSNGTDLLFNSDGEIEEVELSFINGKYIYKPNNIVEFSPGQFSVYATIQKNISYMLTDKYNINITVDDLSSWNDLISLFGNASARSICPPNIKINNESMDVSVLASGSFDNTDFYLIKSPDGRKYSTDLLIDFDEILDKHTNIWLSIDSKNNKLNNIFDTLSNPCESTSPLSKIVYKDKIKVSDKLTHTIKQNNDIISYIFDDSTEYTIQYEYSDNPIVIVEKKNKGFVIISHSSIFDDLNTNSNLIYDAIIKVFIKSYLDTYTITSWITNKNVEYIGTIGRILNKKHEPINLKELVNQKDSTIKNQYSIISVNVDTNKSTPIAAYINTDADQYMHFEKIEDGDNIDPIKPDGYQSLLTTKNTVIYFSPNNIYKIESKIGLQQVINTENNTCKILLKPFKSSKHRLNLTDEVILNIPDLSEVYYLLALPINEDKKSTVRLVPRKSYKYTGEIILGEIRVILTTKRICSDTRVSGGGLPEILPNNYDLLDIGNLYGRLFRAGTSLIIKLPAYLKQYDSYIRDAIEQWKNATTYIAIYYNEQ